MKNYKDFVPSVCSVLALVPAVKLLTNCQQPVTTNAGISPATCQTTQIHVHTPDIWQDPTEVLLRYLTLYPSGREDHNTRQTKDLEPSPC